MIKDSQDVKFQGMKIKGKIDTLLVMKERRIVQKNVNILPKIWCVYLMDHISVKIGQIP